MITSSNFFVGAALGEQVIEGLKILYASFYTNLNTMTNSILNLNFTSIKNYNFQYFLALEGLWITFEIEHFKCRFKWNVLRIGQFRMFIDGVHGLHYLTFRLKEIANEFFLYYENIWCRADKICHDFT